MKTSFKIHTDFDPNEAKFFVEISSHQISSFILDQNNCFNNFYTFPLSNDIIKSEKQVQSIFTQPLFNQSYKKTTIFWALPQSVISPAAFFDSNCTSEVLDLIYGPSNVSSFQTDFLERHNAYNAYRIPQFLHELINQKFPQYAQYHQSSLLANLDYDVNNSVLCVFYGKNFNVLVRKGKNLVCNTYYSFTAPEDVVYYLLAICKNFNLSIDDVNVIVAGLIEKESALYNEIYKYFLHISFFSFSTNYTHIEEFNHYPIHFFNYLFAITTCV